MKSQKNNIAIYQSKSGAIEFKGDLRHETIWATQAQIAEVFDIDRTVVTRHINNLLRNNEVEAKSNVQKMHITNSDKPVALYSLDMILAVGYRTNSTKAIVFRKWATSILRRYLMHGFAVNQKRLQKTAENFKDLQETVRFLERKSKNKLLIGQEKEILSILKEYSKTITLLESFDKNRLSTRRGIVGQFHLDYTTALKVISSVKKEMRLGRLFGQEYDDGLQSVLGNIYQRIKGSDVYPTLESKASHLLYFIIKDHPFVDGNKRIGSLLFIYLLDRNNYLFRKNGERKINDNALTALALIVAISSPADKNRIIKIIEQMVQ